MAMAALDDFVLVLSTSSDVTHEFFPTIASLDYCAFLPEAIQMCVRSPSVEYFNANSITVDRAGKSVFTKYNSCRTSPALPMCG